MNLNKFNLETISQKIIQYKVNRTKEKEIDDQILRQTLFLFNLEMWYQLFIESENFENPTLEINKFI